MKGVAGVAILAAIAAAVVYVLRRGLPWDAFDNCWLPPVEPPDDEQGELGWPPS